MHQELRNIKNFKKQICNAMKNYFVKLATLMFLSISLTLTSCSGDDDDSPEPENQNFLEKYDGTVWGGPYPNNSNEEGFVRFRDSELVPWEEWVTDFGDDGKLICYFYSKGYIQDIGPGEILENLNNKLKISTSESSGQGATGEILSSTIYTFTVDGDNLTINVVIQQFFNDETIERNFYWKRSYENVDNLTLCD